MKSFTYPKFGDTLFRTTVPVSSVPLSFQFQKTGGDKSRSRVVAKSKFGGGDGCELLLHWCMGGWLVKAARVLSRPLFTGLPLALSRAELQGHFHSQLPPEP